MKFTNAIKTTHENIQVEDYFDGRCFECSSTDLTIRSSYVRTLKALGTPREKRIVRIKVNYYVCKECGASFSPKHPDYSPKIEYTPAVIQYALDRYYEGNKSALEIAHVLNRSHQVDVNKDTVGTWVKLHTCDYLKSVEEEDLVEEADLIKAVTIDGTFTSTGKDVIGKKKPAVSLSVTKAKDGTYLLMLSERKT